ncbi:MAG: formyltransferase family protein [Flavobacteriales bacterium]|nr:formyltransferase family protein [Flavobacteriales bacterium]
MNICWVIDETSFYHPDMLAEFLRKTTDKVTGIVIVRKIPRKHNIETYLVRNFYQLHISEIIKLVFRKFYNQLLNYFTKPSTKQTRFYSVRNVCNAFGIPYIEAHNTLNKEEIFQFLQQGAPDVIISSNSLIFSKKLLALPRIACINRHSGLLPAYGGLWPVFQAMANQETQCGVSIHLMETGIDKGAVLCQKAVDITDKDTVDSLYQKCFSISAELILQALDKIRKKDFTPVINNLSPSYYSFPTPHDWEKFRKAGKRFI